MAEETIDDFTEKDVLWENNTPFAVSTEKLAGIAVLDKKGRQALEAEIRKGSVRTVDYEGTTYVVAQDFVKSKLDEGGPGAAAHLTMFFANYMGLALSRGMTPIEPNGSQVFGYQPDNPDEVISLHEAAEWVGLKYGKISRTPDRKEGKNPLPSVDGKGDDVYVTRGEFVDWLKNEVMGARDDGPYKEALRTALVTETGGVRQEALEGLVSSMFKGVNIPKDMFDDPTDKLDKTPPYKGSKKKKGTRGRKKKTAAGKPTTTEAPSGVYEPSPDNYRSTAEAREALKGLMSTPTLSRLLKTARDDELITGRPATRGTGILYSEADYDTVFEQPTSKPEATEKREKLRGVLKRYWASHPVESVDDAAGSEAAGTAETAKGGYKLNPHAYRTVDQHVAGTGFTKPVVNALLREAREKQLITGIRGRTGGKLYSEVDMDIALGLIGKSERSRLSRAKARAQYPAYCASHEPFKMVDGESSPGAATVDDTVGETPDFGMGDFSDSVTRKRVEVEEATGMSYGKIRGREDAAKNAGAIPKDAKQPYTELQWATVLGPAWAERHPEALDEALGLVQTLRVYTASHPETGQPKTEG